MKKMLGISIKMDRLHKRREKRGQTYCLFKERVLNIRSYCNESVELFQWELYKRGDN